MKKRSMALRRTLISILYLGVPLLFIPRKEQFIAVPMINTNLSVLGKKTVLDYRKFYPKRFILSIKNSNFKMKQQYCLFTLINISDMQQVFLINFILKICIFGQKNRNQQGRKSIQWIEEGTCYHGNTRSATVSPFQGG